MRIILDKKYTGQNLLNVLRDSGHFVSAFCGGQGICGKCKVRFISDPPESTDADRRHLSEEELRDGWRLSCGITIHGALNNLKLEVKPSNEDAILAGTGFHIERKVTTSDAKYRGNPETAILAVDIGTTTIAAALVSPVFRTTMPYDETVSAANSQRDFSIDGMSFASSVNHQRAFGADVISRMDASNKGKGAELQRIVNEDILKLSGKLGISPEDFEDPAKTHLVISANSTMEHLLQGLSCESLGVAPYTPVDISLHEYKNMTILPGISTFVGADIVSGIIACGMDESAEVCLLIDLGTNGEMVIGNRDRLLSASTAAGPAFEGGNISCGVAGIPGAISSVTIENGKPEIRTLSNMPPIGICGTGVLETTFELYQAGITDETGLMDDAYFDDGYPLSDHVRFSADDVREVQLAKSAIRAGVEVLLREYGVSCREVSKVFLAGGFGEYIDTKKAIGIGLLPEDFAGRIEAVGNSSLAGAILYARNPGLRERFIRTAQGTGEIALAENRLFNDFYLEHMLFPEKTG